MQHQFEVVQTQATLHLRWRRLGRSEHDGSIVTGRTRGWSGNTLGEYVNAEIYAAVGGHVTFHKLRHRYGSLGCQRTKDPKALAQQMGHASVSTTMTFYAAAPTKRPSRSPTRWRATDGPLGPLTLARLASR